MVSAEICQTRSRLKLRFPRTVNNAIKDLLLEAAFPSQNLDERRLRAEP
jgi:hypothetical protein